MKFEFFEGAAGTGKTHNLVGRAGELVQDGAIIDGQKLLALTFMNGARRRLAAHLGENPIFCRRFDCQTFDVFARTLTARRKSLITPTMQNQAAAFSVYDGPCFLAASLLEIESVRQWVARTFPVVLVDEAQDLDEHRLHILQKLSQTCRVVAAADAFQCLQDKRDTDYLIDWLSNAGQTHRLTHNRRTQQQGLLAAALAVRESHDIKSVLTYKTSSKNSKWISEGFQLLEVPATTKNPGLLSWTMAFEISQRQGQLAILTPDARSPIIRDAIAKVQTKQWDRPYSFGPYPLAWDRHDTEEADALLAKITLPDVAPCADMCEILTPAARNAAIAHAIRRIDRLRRVQGQTELTAKQVTAFVQDSVRNRARLGFGSHRGHLAMTIQRAKNREFPNVIVLWPHTATGSPEHLRKLLYNGITRARNHCTVIALGKNRLDAPPFAP